MRIALSLYLSLSASREVEGRFVGPRFLSFWWMEYAFIMFRSMKNTFSYSRRTVTKCVFVSRVIPFSVRSCNRTSSPPRGLFALAKKKLKYKNKQTTFCLSCFHQKTNRPSAHFVPPFCANLILSLDLILVFG